MKLLPGDLILVRYRDKQVKGDYSTSDIEITMSAQSSIDGVRSYPRDGSGTVGVPDKDVLIVTTCIKHDNLDVPEVCLFSSRLQRFGWLWENFSTRHCVTVVKRSG